MMPFRAASKEPRALLKQRARNDRPAPRCPKLRALKGIEVVASRQDLADRGFSDATFALTLERL
jgi:hypothetical protein